MAVEQWLVVMELPKTTANEPDTGKSILSTILVALILMVPILVGLAFGYLSWTLFHRLQDQAAVDLHGVSIHAKIEGLKIEKFEQRNTGPRAPTRDGPPSLFCVIQLAYTTNEATEPIRKVFWLEDDTVCKRYLVNDAIAGKVLPDDPDIFVLDESRLEAYWLWISLSLFILFAIVPTGLVLRALMRKWTAAGGVS